MFYKCTDYGFQLHDYLCFHICLHCIGAVRHLVQHFRQSPKAMSALRKKYALSRNPDDPQTINLIMDTPTRWNSTYEMLKVLFNHQFVVCLILTDESVTPCQAAMHLKLRDSHWIIIQKLAELLEPIRVSVFIHCYIPR